MPLSLLINPILSDFKNLWALFVFIRICFFFLFPRPFMSSMGRARGSLEARDMIPIRVTRGSAGMGFGNKLHVMSSKWNVFLSRQYPTCVR